MRPVILGRISYRLCALAAAMCASVSLPASAAFVNVGAAWGANVGYSGLPPGIEFSGGGDELVDSRTFTGNDGKTFTSRETVTVTNTLATPFTDGFDFLVFFSAFDPDISDLIGLSIDNTKETAAYRSTVEGPGVYDLHSCSLPAASMDGYVYFSPVTCGVLSPDFSEADVYVGELNPHQTKTFDYTITISDHFSLVPEPSVLTILAPVTLGLGLLRRRRSA